MIPTFDTKMSNNFNCSMYVDNLILVTKASRKNARNCNHCYKIYYQFMGHRPNRTNSAVYFPSKFNKRLFKVISSTMNFKIRNYPFTNLGVLIAPKWLSIAQFQPLASKVNTIFSCQNHRNISIDGVINNTMLSIPFYYLCTYSISNSVLEFISRIAMKFCRINVTIVVASI